MKLIVPEPACSCSAESARSAEALSEGMSSAMPRRATMISQAKVTKVVLASVRLMR